MTSRPCIKCGKLHDLILKNTLTNERISEFESCYDCLMLGCSFISINEVVHLTAETLDDIDPVLTRLMDKIHANMIKEMREFS